MSTLTKRKPVNLKEPVARNLAKLAKATNRTNAGTVEWLVNDKLAEIRQHKSPQQPQAAASDNGKRD